MTDRTTDHREQSHSGSGDDEPGLEESEEKRTLPVSRRTLLAGAAFGAGVGVGAAGTATLLRRDLPLGQDSVAQPGGEIPDDHVPFSIWGELRDAFRTSSDHLPGRAEELVAGGDLESIFAFVRDEVVTVPTGINDTQYTESGTRWGTRGTLRCGMGTPRDKADLLADLCRQAGYEATVRAADDGLSEEAVREHYTREVERVFDPDIQEEAVSDWYDRLNDEPREAEAFATVDEDAAESEALATEIAAALDDPTEVRGAPEPFSWEWGSRNRVTPVVEVTVQGETQYMNLFADVSFGEAGGDVSEIREREEAETVRVSLTAVTPRTLDEPMELVSGEWTVPELIGRQLLALTTPIAEPYENPTATIGDLDTFTPTLVLQGPDLSQEEATDGSVFGDPFTLHGDRLSATENGVVSRNGEPFYRPESTVEPVDVASLSAEVDPVDYPTIRLEVTATDNDGAHVEGLPATAFSVTDEGEGVMPTMTENRARAHVMYIRDDSGSMGRGVEAATDDEWYEELRSIITGHEAMIDLEYREVDSDMWTHLTDAVADGPDLIIYAHDGVETDEYVETMDDLLANAPATVLLSAYDESSPVEDETVLAQADLTEGVAVPMGETETVHEAVIDALDDLDLPTYRFDYHVPDDETGEREVTVGLGDEAMEASATYDPRVRNPIPRTMVGLYLTIESGGEEVTRTLGGWDPDLDNEWDPYHDEPETAIDAELGAAQAHALDVHGAILGGVTISVEGDGVPFSVAVDDVLAGRETFAPMDVAGVEGDHEDRKAVMEQGGTLIPYDPLLAQSPLPDAANERGVTFFEHPRIALSQQKLRLGTNEVEQSIDVLPLTQAATTAEDPEERFLTTLERTARIALIERTAYEISTGSLLDGVELVNEDAFDADHDHRASYRDLADRAGFSRRDHQLVPADGSAFALWNVDARTGTLTGVLDDGTGGGRRVREIEDRLDRLSQVAGMLNLWLMGVSASGAVSAGGAFALGVVAIYGQQLARMYANVTLVLITMSARDIEDMYKHAILSMVCGVAFQIAFGAFGNLGFDYKFFATVIGILDNTAGALGESTPTSCGL